MRHPAHVTLAPTRLTALHVLVEAFSSAIGLSEAPNFKLRQHCAELDVRSTKRRVYEMESNQCLSGMHIFKMSVALKTKTKRGRVRQCKLVNTPSAPESLHLVAMTARKRVHSFRTQPATLV